MEIDLIFKIAAVGIIVSILNQVLVRSGREEQATMTTLAALVRKGVVSMPSIIVMVSIMSSMVRQNLSMLPGVQTLVQSDV